MNDDVAGRFEPHREFLRGLAYRMLGSLAEAEDVVQDAFLRWHDLDHGAVAEPRAFLARTVTRLCLDRIKSARAQRERYVGTWLPEPVVGAPNADAAVDAPDARLALADDLSVALLVTLERLSPLERAAFLLHDVFDMDYAAVADVLERSEPAIRQLAARAREHVRDARPRFRTSGDDAARLAGAFHDAATRGDLGALSGLLAEDAVFYSDGGGKRRAALNPIRGRDRILRFFVGVARKRDALGPTSLARATINGLPGFLVHSHEGVETLALEVAGEGDTAQIVAIYAVRNPDKLRHLA